MIQAGEPDPAAARGTFEEQALAERVRRLAPEPSRQFWRAVKAHGWPAAVLKTFGAELDESTTPYMTADEAAAYLKMGLRTLRGLIKDSLVPFKRTPGGRLLFDRRQLDLWLEDDCPKPDRGWLQRARWRRGAPETSSRPRRKTS